MRLDVLMQEKADAKLKATSAIDKAVAENRDMTAAEKAQYDEGLAEVARIDSDMRALARQLNHVAPVQKTKLSTMPEMKKIGSFLRNGLDTGFGTDISAAITTGTQSTLIPTNVVQTIIDDTPGADAFLQAGARFFDTDHGQPINVPIIGAGADFSTFAEGSAPNTSQDPTTYVLSFGTPEKYDRLVKITDEALTDVGFDIASAITTELFKTLSFGYSKVVTQGLVTSLLTHAPVIPSGRDLYSTLISLVTAIDPIYQSDSNIFMMSREILGLLLDSRDTQGRPLFDASSNKLLGRYGLVINDHLGHIVFGNFNAGVFIRRTPLLLRRFTELYAESGEIGIRLERRLDSKYFATVTNGAGPQPLAIQGVDEGS